MAIYSTYNLCRFNTNNIIFLEHNCENCVVLIMTTIQPV